MLRTQFNAKSALLTLGTISILALAACAPKNQTQSAAANRVSVSSIESNSSMTASEKAEALSQLANRLVTPTSFMHAYDVAVRALAQDPSNSRAKFIKGVLAPQMELQGIVKRIAPLVAGHPKLQVGYKQLWKDILDTHDESLIKFAAMGPGDISTERQAQEVIARYIVRLDELRKTLGEMKDTEFELEINVSSNPAAKPTDCHIELKDGAYDFSKCEDQVSFKRTVNQADIEIMKQYVAYQQVYMTVANSYDASGALNFSGAGKAKPEIYAEILRNSRAGKLRKTNGLGVIPDIVKDAVVGVRWAMGKQNELCAQGKESSLNRPKNLMTNGACLGSKDQTETILTQIEFALAGSQITVPVDGKQVTIVPLQLVESPVEDLRSQPLSFTCGDVSAIGDGTLDGAFPTGDLNKLFKTSSSCN